MTGRGRRSRKSDASPPAKRATERIVLIVDDDRATLRSLDAHLSDRGYTVVSMARVSEELTRLARVLKPRAILLAHNPSGGVDGLEALRTLRRDSALDAVPILLFSERIDVLESAHSEIVKLAAVARAKPIAGEEVLEFLLAPPPRSCRAIIGR